MKLTNDKVKKLLTIRKLKKRKIDLVFDMKEKYAEVCRINDQLEKLGVEVKRSELTK